MLASTGATPGQIRNTVFFEGAILGLIGTPPVSYTHLDVYKRQTYNNELLQYLGISKNYQAMAMLYSVAGIVILLIVVGSVTVIYNAFAISVSERKKQFGMLASTGRCV